MRPARRRYIVGLVLVAALGQSPHAAAYELRTHGEITRHAFDKSEGVKTYLSLAGLQKTDTFDLNARTASGQLAGFENTGTARDWMIEGAIREDDYVKSAAGTFGCPEPQNPPSQVNRLLNHFFDVQRGGRGLTVFGQALGLPAPDWALGLQGRGSAPDQNQFSLPDAREYQYQSLTAPSRDGRDRHTARLFRTLGHAVHSLQDMAQPQHTRNDPHAGCVEFVAGEHSWYENYVEMRALGQRFRRRGQVSPTLALDGYDPVDIRPYREFFTDSSQRGLADFSSRNFLSAGTNLSWLIGNCGGLPEPSCEAAAYGTEDRDFAIPTIAGTISGTMTLYTRHVVDRLTGATIPRVPISSRSFWDQHLEAKQLLPLFSLNTINHDAAADILVPRAVAYSAGFLNAFFRGNVSATYEAAQQISISGSAETMTGDFELLYDTADGTRRSLARWAALRIDPEQTSPSLSVPQLPPDAAPDNPCWLIFRGQLGLESGAVVGSRAACPPAPLPPQHGPWTVYSCLYVEFGSPQNNLRYTYATPDPPLFDDGLPATVFHRSPPLGSTTCSLIAMALPAQPPNVLTEHPV